MPQVFSEDQCQQAYRWASPRAQDYAWVLQVAQFVSGSFVCTFRTTKGHWQTGPVAMGCDHNIQRDWCPRVRVALNQVNAIIILTLPIHQNSVLQALKALKHHVFNLPELKSVACSPLNMMWGCEIDRTASDVFIRTYRTCCFQDIHDVASSSRAWCRFHQSYCPTTVHPVEGRFLSIN